MGLLSSETLSNNKKLKSGTKKVVTEHKKIRSDVCLLVKKVRQDLANRTKSLVES